MARERINPQQRDVVVFDDVSIALPRRRRRRGDGTAKRLRRLAGETRRDTVQVLRSASVSIAPGQSVALVGAKGPSREAFLRLAAGTLLPDAGSVSRRERIVPMIDVARAMRTGYTVRQNIYLVGGLLGMTPAQVADALDAIVFQCGAEAVLDKYLGSAPRLMRQKLSWATSLATGARAFAVDQMLVVGEREFRQRCWTTMDSLREDGVTFIVSSDSARLLQRFCGRALLFDGPSIVADTSVADAVARLKERRRSARDREHGDSEGGN